MAILENRVRILGYFLKYTKIEHKAEVERHVKFRSFGDLTKPHLDYPLARELKVSFLLFVLLFVLLLSLSLFFVLCSLFFVLFESFF